MDGTIFNSEIAHARALQEIFDELLPGHRESAEEILQRSYGKADADIYTALPALYAHLSLQDFLSLKNNKVVEVIARTQREEVFAPEIEAFLYDVFDKGYRLALVTASESTATHPVLATMGVDHLFEVTLTSTDLPQTKPHPLPYLTALQRLRAATDEALIFEDSPTGLESARRSGIPYCKAEWYL